MPTLRTSYHVPHLADLVEILDEVVLQEAGLDISDAIHRIRRLAIERRAGMPEAAERLATELNQLALADAAEVLRAFTMYFDLANLAEDLNRIRTLRERSHAAEDPTRKRRETIQEAITSLRDQGLSAGQMQALISRLRIEPVFTAHPSEAKRRTTRLILRRLRETLIESTFSQSSAEARRSQQRRIRADLTTMWQSDLLRPRRPRVMSEVERGLFFAEALWEVVPQITRDLREALSNTYPDDHFQIPPLVRFGTWIGGDRDGHPFVTTEITRGALDMMRDTALAGHLRQCRQLQDVIVMSDRHTANLEPLKQAVETACRMWPELAQSLEHVSATEIGRQWLTVIEQRLLSTANGNHSHPSSYARATDLEHDIDLLRKTLTDAGSRVAVETYLQPWLDTVRSFGLHFAAMDIRQHSTVHTTAVTELLRKSELCENFAELSEDERIQLLLQTVDHPLSLNTADHNEPTAELLSLFALLAERVNRHGLSVFGGYVISMTHAVSDVLAVWWLWHHAWKLTTQEPEPPPLPIVPLFETVEDLERAPAIMESLWNMPAYRHHVRNSADDSQMVMIGYSDSTKDGGYLAAGWKLHQAQSRLAGLADRHGVRLIIFHGRGGALGRGGGPAARAVLSLPPEAVNGAMRVTEQGEILAERYDDPEIAYRHLEQVTWATLRVSGDARAEIPTEFETTMTSMAELSLSEYRRLVTHSGFLAYFEAATPVSEIETLPIGSRPSRRGNRRSLGDLRAIPWTFAWTQSRHLLPAWYGLGTALRQMADQHNGDWRLLREMYANWRFFSAAIDNAELAVAKSDIDIARRYRELCDAPATEEIWQMIQTEYDRSRAAILLLKEQTELLEHTHWLQRSIRARNPSIDPLNLLQIRLLAQTRASTATVEVDREAESIAAHVLRLTINGIAAGLRTTG